MGAFLYLHLCKVWVHPECSGVDPCNGRPTQVPVDRERQCQAFTLCSIGLINDGNFGD